MLCVPLWIDERGLGALSLYADQAAAFSDPHERVTTLLATFAALALAEAQRADQMHDALANRDVIGQAKGILMERHGITADAAFGVLSRVSQAENRKLAEIARRFAETGELPDCDQPRSMDPPGAVARLSGYGSVAPGVDAGHDPRRGRPAVDGWRPGAPVTWPPASSPSRVAMSCHGADVLWPTLPAGSSGSSDPATPAASQTARAVAR